MSGAGAFERVAIIGTGFIGASLGLAIKQLPRPPRVTGFDMSRDAAVKASRTRAIDRVAGSLNAAVQDADLVIIATPVRGIRSVLEEISSALPTGAVVSDTGSTKSAVASWASALLPAHVSFVGGHPMTGPLTGGTLEPDASIFRGAVYCVTPTARSTEKGLETVVRLVESIGAVPYFLDPDEHDSLVAGVSHLPYLVAAALMSALARANTWPEMAKLAAGNLAVATGPLSGDPQMYADICATNRDHIVRHLESVERELAYLRHLIDSGDGKLLDAFQRARQHRLDWLANRASKTTGPQEEARPQGMFLPPGLTGLLRRPERED